MNNEYKYETGDTARILASGVSGEVINRREGVSNTENTYQLRYASGDGQKHEDWFNESALDAELFGTKTKSAITTKKTTGE